MDEKARENNRLRQRRFLELHKEEVNTRRRERYHERLSHGKCPRCGGRVKKGRTLCPECCEYMLDLNRKYAGQKKKSAVKAKPKAKAAVKAKPRAKAKPAAKAKPKAKAKKR
jgi:predicted nucleic acid-binding Zn ribbon protein